MYEHQLLPNYLRVKKYFGSVDLTCVLKLNGHASCIALGKSLALQLINPSSVTQHNGLPQDYSRNLTVMYTEYLEEQVTPNRHSGSSRSSQASLCI